MPLSAVQHTVDVTVRQRKDGADAFARRQPRPHRVRYFIMLIKDLKERRAGWE